VSSVINCFPVNDFPCWSFFSVIWNVFVSCHTTYSLKLLTWLFVVVYEFSSYELKSVQFQLMLHILETALLWVNLIQLFQLQQLLLNGINCFFLHKTLYVIYDISRLAVNYVLNLINLSWHHDAKQALRKLSQWNRFLDELIVAQLVKKIPTFLWNLMLHCCVYNGFSHVLILSKINLVYTFLLFFIRSILILSFIQCLNLPSSSFIQAFQRSFCTQFRYSACMLYVLPISTSLIL
jgi:hypothetical protein